MYCKALATLLALSLSCALAIAEPITLTCEYADPKTEKNAKIQFTIDPATAKLANSAVSNVPTIPAFEVWDDFWFFYLKGEEDGQFVSSTVVLNKNGTFWVTNFFDRHGTENDGASFITGECPPIASN